MSAAASGPLAKQYVEFASKGLDQLQDAFKAIRGSLATTDAASIALSQSINKTISDMGSQLTAAKGQAIALSEALKSGAYREFAQEMARTNLELDKLHRQMQWEDLKASKGVFSAWAGYVTGKITEVSGAVLGGLRGAFQQATQTMQQGLVNPVAIGAAVAGFQMLTESAKSWAQAGLAGTTHGNALAAQFTLLSQQIAGVFVPTINMVIRAVSVIVQWFRELNGDQQGMIRRFVEAAAVMVIVNQMLGRLTSTVMGFVATTIGGMAAAAGSILTTLIPAIGTLVTAVVTGSGIATAALGVATSGISVAIGIASALVGALVSVGLAGTVLGAGLAVGTQSGREGLSRLLAAFRPIMDMVGQVGALFTSIIGPAIEKLGESAGNAFARLGMALTSVLTGATPLLEGFADRVADAADAISDWVDGIDFTPLASGLSTIVDWIGRIDFDAVTAAIASTGVVIVRVATWIKDAWDASFAKLGEPLGELYQALLRLNEALQWSQGMVSLVSAAFSGWLTGSLAIARAWGDGMVIIIRTVVTVIDWFVEKITVTIPNALNRMIASVRQAMLDMAVTLARVANSLNDTLAAPIRAAALQLLAMRAALEGVKFNVGLSSASTATDVSGRPARPPGASRPGGAPRTDVEEAGGRFETAMDLFRRINEAAIKTQIPEQTLEEARRLREIAERIETSLAPSVDAPPVAPPGGPGIAPPGGG